MDYMSTADVAIKNGADINTPGRGGKTPLAYAVVKGSAPLVRLLLGYKPLLLLEAGADL
jgi:ankyrin repeat protein